MPNKKLLRKNKEDKKKKFVSKVERKFQLIKVLAKK